MSAVEEFQRRNPQPDEAIDKVFAVMALAPQHTYQILTKRANRMRRYMTHWPDGASRFHHVAYEAHKIRTGMEHGMPDGFVWQLQRRWPLPNVWLGVSVEDQARADERIPDLLAAPAAVRFLSAEPLLGPVSIKDEWLQHLDWIICGGESGPRSRPMHPDWARSLRNDCQRSGTYFFFKQRGEHAPVMVDDIPGDPTEVMRRVGKKRAGAKLDGVEHRSFPR